MSATVTVCRACGALMRQHPTCDAYSCLGCGALIVAAIPDNTGRLSWKPFAEKLSGKGGEV